MPDQVWRDRFEALDSRIEALQQTIAESTVDRKQTLAQLTACLREFATRQFCYFYDGFEPDTGKLEVSPEYSPEHVLTVILEQIGFDLEAIQWAVEQRRQGDARMEQALSLADKLAWQALSPALALFDLAPDITVLTYFQKFAEIRVIPYAPVALIGVPITCVSLSDGRSGVTRDHLAIPHEVAHYVYWHGKYEDKPLQDYLHERLAELPWGCEWLEEVFADVYGCLIAGPVIAQSFQDLQMRVTQTNFYADDGEHPPPVIRPDIYTKVIAKKLGLVWAGRMNQLWTDKRQQRPQQANGELNGGPGILYARTGERKQAAEMISLVDSQDNSLISPEADRPLDIMINTVLEIVAGLELNAWWLGYANLQAAPPEELDLYNAFAQHFDESANDLPEPGGHKDELEGQTLQDCSPHQIKAYGVPEEQPVSPTVWLHTFRAGGWTTKGPQGNPTGD